MNRQRALQRVFLKVALAFFEMKSNRKLQIQKIVKKNILYFAFFSIIFLLKFIQIIKKTPQFLAVLFQLN